MIVEDDTALRQVTREFLEASGYRSFEAATPDEALLLSARHHGPIDLLLSDVIMPGMNGHALAMRLLSARPRMKVLYISGYTDEAILGQGLLQEGLAFLQKPFSRYDLTRKIREVLDQPHRLTPVDSASPTRTSSTGA